MYQSFDWELRSQIYEGIIIVSLYAGELTDSEQMFHCKYFMDFQQKFSWLQSPSHK